MSHIGTTQHTMLNPGWPDPGTQSTLLTTAIKLVRRYRDDVPSAERIRRDFGVSRATAYRWRAALKAANLSEMGR